MMRGALLAAAFLGPFLFPAALGMALAAAAALAFPPAALALGVLYDLLYYAPGQGFPLATCVGAAAMALGYGVRGFVAARMMTG